MYLLDKKEEALRLENQATFANYSIESELSRYLFDSQKRILDAGCGTGLGMRYVATKNPFSIVDGIDISEDRVHFANTEFRSNNFNNASAQVGNLNDLSIASDSYDLIYSRYVFQHLNSPEVALSELFRVLKPQGKLVVIDFDGPIYNLDTSNNELKALLALVQKLVPYNAYVGRSLHGMFYRQGFKNINCQLISMPFQTREEIYTEYHLIKGRLENAFDGIAHFIGKVKAARFVELYLSELLSPDSFLYYTKFIVAGEK